MKKFYEAAEINVFYFERKDVIVASGVIEDTTATSYTLEENETEIL